MSLFISNPSRGIVAPSVAGDPTGVKALDSIRVSLRETVSKVNFGSMQMGVGYAKIFATGTNSFELLLPRTIRSSLLQTVGLSDPTFVLTPPELQITKTASGPQASVYFTSVDGKTTGRKSVMVSSVFFPLSVVSYVPGPGDPLGQVLGLENGPRQTAAYVTFLQDNTPQKIIRICGPLVGGVRSPDLYIPYDWQAAGFTQYILCWSEEQQLFLLYSDSSLGLGGISNATLIASVPIGQFQQFGLGGSVQMGGNNDYTAIYGTEGPSAASVGIKQISIATDGGFPVVGGARYGGWRTYLDSDMTVGFSGRVDPTRLPRGGAWFRTVGSDPAGVITPSVGGYSRLQKKTPGTGFSIYRDEPSFRRTATDGFMVEFKINLGASGGTGFDTGCSIQVADGTSLFQLDFLQVGSTVNVGLLKSGGNPASINDHLIGPAPIPFVLRTLRLIADSRRGVITLLDVADPATPLATWVLNRAVLPVSSSTSISAGFCSTTSAAVGTFDIYALKYSYLYQAWEAADLLTPVQADPVFQGGAGVSHSGPLNLAVMPGVDPLPYSGSGDLGSASFVADGYEITCAPTQSLVFERDVPNEVDVNRGGVLEFSTRVGSWHPGARTSVLGFLDDGLQMYILSFMDSAAGKFVCVPLSGGLGPWQEFPGTVGLAAKLSAPVDWTQFHTYRIERRPRDGTYVFIDNVQVLVIPDSAGYSFPHSLAGTPKLGFGQYTEEGGSSVWKFVRGNFGTGYELSTALDRSSDELRSDLANVRATVVVTAGT